MPARLTSPVSRALLILSLGPSCSRPPPPAVAPFASPLPVAVAVAPSDPPPPDGDRDGIPDAADRCPDLPEDLDQFEDDDGCPDRDNDGDGIPDALEWTGERWTNCDHQVRDGVVQQDCRDRPETFNGILDHDGCPEATFLCGSDPLISAPLSYDPATLEFADISPLDEVVAFARDCAVLSVRIEAHAGPSTPERARRLSQRAGERVRVELVRRGVSEAKLQVLSWGEEKPRDNNRTPEGRRNNHRVELTGVDSCRLTPEALAWRLICL